MSPPYQETIAMSKTIQQVTLSKSHDINFCAYGQVVFDKILAENAD